jgi:type IV secretory pathway TraG/TraD family ATPase VirD4
MRSHCWNPLDAVDRWSTKRFDDIMRQIYLLIPDPKGDSATAIFWQPAARMALAGITWMLAEMPEESFTLENVLTKFLRGDGLAWLTNTIDARRSTGKPFSERVVLAVSDYVGKGERLTEDIRKSVSTNLQAFQNPHIAAATNHSDFDLRNLRREPISLYVTVSPGHIPRVDHLLRLLFGSIVNLNTDATPEQDPALQYPVLILLDEFARLGAMPALTQAAQFARGYGIRIAYIIQDKAQLVDLYGVAGAADVFSNLGVEIVFGTGDIKLAKEYEERLGDWTMLFTTRNQSRFFPWLNWQRMNVAQHPHRRPRILDQEIVMMPPDEQLIVRPGMKPARSKRIRWYTDPTFRRLVHDTPDVPLLNVQIADDNGSIRLPVVPSNPGASPAKSPQANPNRKGANPDPDEWRRIAERLGWQPSIADPQARINARGQKREARGQQRQPSLALPKSAAPPSTPENRAEVPSAAQDQALFDAERQPDVALPRAHADETWRAKSDLDYWASQVVEGWVTFDDVLAFAFQKRLARAKAAGSQEIDHDLIAKKAMEDVVQAIDNYERHRKRSC